jgi:urea carboxylase-associated protein 2
MSLYQQVIPGGAGWSMPVRAGRTVALTALGDDANLSMLIFGNDRLDRLNVPDTLKAQLSACIRPPMVLMSDRGLALASVTASSLRWHDALTGFGQDRHLARFGESSYASDRNLWRRSARTGLISELAKHGLGEADLHGCINFFSRVAVADDERASLSFVRGHSHSGDTVTLRTEQDVLLVAATTMHPLDPAIRYAPQPIQVEVDLAAEMAPDDPSVLFREQSARALLQTRMTFA